MGFELRSDLLSVEKASQLLQELSATLPWLPRRVAAFGHKVPRDECWLHLQGSSYRFGGNTYPGVQEWPQALKTLHSYLCGELGYAFNSVMANLYQDGKDSVAWHSDDDVELGSEPLIASVTLGATRAFRIRRKDNHRDSHTFQLQSGDVLIMDGDSQDLWDHCVPKTKKVIGPRLNLTFRRFTAL